MGVVTRARQAHLIRSFGKEPTMAQERQEVGSVEYERAGENYLRERQLSRVAGPVLLRGQA
jgi:hypothetical protein